MAENGKFGGREVVIVEAARAHQWIEPCSDHCGQRTTIPSCQREHTHFGAVIAQHLRYGRHR